LGGENPTLTDANVVLQILNPAQFLGGRMKVEREKAVHAIEGLANELGLDLNRTAQGIISVATANMAKAIRVISVQRGHDPRDYALMAFGGGGPLHAARLARELDMSSVIVPLTPGALCALGLLMTDLKADFAKSRLTALSSATPEGISETFVDLEEQANVWFDLEGISQDKRIVNKSADIRYVGQNYELQIPMPAGPTTSDTISALRTAFESAHTQRYGFAPEDEEIEMVTLRIEAVGLVKKADIKVQSKSDNLSPPTPVETRQVWMPEVDGVVSCPVFARSDLKFGHTIVGPAIVEQMDTTTLILPEMTGRIDAYLNLILENRA
jgi:N-methylhydantoinase A